MFTKFVVERREGEEDRPEAADPRGREHRAGIRRARGPRRDEPEREEPEARERETEEDGRGGLARRARVARVVAEHEEPRDLVADDDVEAPHRGHRAVARQRGDGGRAGGRARTSGRRRRRGGAARRRGPRGRRRAARRRRRRSRERRGRTPRTARCAAPPKTRAHAEAAITLFTAIHAKFVT